MARKKGCTIDVREKHHVVVVGDMEIWDGADLALLRETLARLVDSERRKAVGIDLSFVKYIPSGFFGMLYDYAERGISVRVYSPQPHVREMLWFREFFDALAGDAFQLGLRQQTATSAREKQTRLKAPWATADAPQAITSKESPKRDSVPVLT